jgi:two-component sensor histidine kinase
MITRERNEGRRTFQVLLVEDNAGDARVVLEMLQSAATARFELTHVARQLGATVQVGRRYGTTFTISFPVHGRA